MQVLIWNKNEELAEKVLKEAEQEKITIFLLDEKKEDINHTAYVIRKYSSPQFYQKWINYLKTLINGENQNEILKAVIGYYHAIDQEPDEEKLTSNNYIPKLPKSGAK